MRQIGTLPNQVQAERLTAFLLTQGVPAHAEQEDESWAIWVRDEDHLAEAKEALEHFVQDPDDSRYQGVHREAIAILDAESKRREEARRNVVQMRGRWNRSASRRSPLVVATIILCVIFFLLSGFKANPTSVAMRTLSFCDTMQRADWNGNRLADRLIDIRAGQIWRLVTPIFLHGDIFHLAFNMFMFHMFGSMIEDRRGAVRLALIMLVVALISNLAQGLAPSDWGRFSGSPAFLGMSGVVYGLLGYLWMKTTYEPDSGLYVSGRTVAFLLIWMLLGFAGALESFGIRMANLAHGVGFLTGLAIGYWPVLVQRLKP
jgi:GlpG protein